MPVLLKIPVVLATAVSTWWLGYWALLALNRLSQLIAHKPLVDMDRAKLYLWLVAIAVTFIVGYSIPDDPNEYVIVW